LKREIKCKSMTVDPGKINAWMLAINPLQWQGFFLMLMR